MAYDKQYGTASMEEIIEFLQNILQQEFARDVTSVYFGDIGIYPPSVFGASRKDTKAILIIQPVSSVPIPGERVAESEKRTMRLQIIAMVNITPFFTAQPSEAYGERILVNLITRVAKFLSLEQNSELDGRVLFSRVENIDWEWTQRKDQSLRGAAISYEADVRVFRQ